MKQILINGLINVIFFSLVLYFFKPLLNSGDDAFVMYSFSGAFGVNPTHLVDYNHVWHFVLSIPVVWLFSEYPEINWYTGFLLLYHFIAANIICYVFLNKLNVNKAVFAFLLFFLFFEIPFLLSLSFTNSSIILSISCNLLLVDALINKNLSQRKLLFSVFLLIGAGLLRFHAWGFVEIFFVPFLLFFKRKQFIQYSAFKFGLLVTLFIAFLVHVEHYKKDLPTWEKQETTRQILYKLYNKPRAVQMEEQVFSNEVERDFFSNGFFYDTTIFNDKKLEDIVNGLVRNRNFSEKGDSEIVYWSFMESRVFLFLFFLTFFFLFLSKQKAALRKTIPFLSISLLLYGFLFVFRKVTGYMFITFFTVNWLIIVLLTLNEGIPIRIVKHKLLIFPLLVVSIIWIGIRLFALNSININKYSGFLCSFNELKANSNRIHIASNNMLPIDFFSITDVPQTFMINNYISISQFPKHVYYQKLRQFKIENVIVDLIQRENMVLIGNRLNSLNTYYLNNHNKKVELIKDTVNYKCESVFKVKLVTNR